MVICIRVGQMTEMPIDGSVVGQCSLCDADVWIAPSSQKVISEQLLPVYCMGCAAALSKSEPMA
jgi:hypothetical protein